jgi:mono/diheme cytochrome c family protein
MKKISIISFIFLAIVVTIVSCHDKTKPGRNYMPDMAYSRAYETYSENPLFPDHQTNRTPVAGTIERGQLLPFHIAKDKTGDTTNFTKASLVPNPLPPLDSSAMVESERLYLIYCGICHGPKLDGNGPLWKDGNGPFPAAPRNLMEPRIVNMPDGQIFYTATYGKNKMGSYASQLSMRQRWMVIHYIKAQQNKLNPSAAVVTDSSSVKK